MPAECNGVVFLRKMFISRGLGLYSSQSCMLDDGVVQLDWCHLSRSQCYGDVAAAELQSCGSWLASITYNTDPASGQLHSSLCFSICEYCSWIIAVIAICPRISKPHEYAHASFVLNLGVPRRHRGSVFYLFGMLIFSERATHVQVSLYVVVRPSVVCRLSVCNVRAPYSGD